MSLFYCENIENQSVISLSVEESLHLTKVLRLKKNDKIEITDGKGFLYKATIIDNKQKQCVVEINDKEIKQDIKPYKLHIALAPTKNIERFEWFVEKSVEIGIDKITPIISRHSERKVIKTDRIEKIIISAMKQSQKYHKPVFDSILDFNDFICNCNNKQKFIAYCKADNLLSKYKFSDDIIFVVGPEGGFDEDEIELAKSKGFEPVLINNFRLRTETAGVFIASSVGINFL